MRHIRVWWNAFKTVALAISFTFNMILLIVLLLLLMQVFQIKNGIIEPLVDGLHRNFVGLDEAVIERTIEVDDEIPVEFDLPLKQQTNVVLTGDVPLAASATFTLPGGGGVINGRVDIVLPQGLILPVQLDMTVPVDTDIPITLPVDVVIPLKETQLHTPLDNLRGLLDGYVRLLDNLPGNWGDVPDFLADAIRGDGANLFEPTAGSENPWPGLDAHRVDGPKKNTSAESTTAPENQEDMQDGSVSGETSTPAPTATSIEGTGIITPPGQ